MIALGLFGLLIAVSASRGWWLPIAPVVLIGLVAVGSWISAARRPEGEDPLPDVGPLLWAILAMAVTLGVAIGWSIRLFRTGQSGRAAMMLTGVALPIVGLWTLAAT